MLLNNLLYTYDCNIDPDAVIALASIASGEEKRAAANKEKWISFETTLRMMAILAEYYEETGDIAQARRETDAAERMLLALSEDPVIGAFDRYLEGIRDSQERLASLAKE